MTNREAFLTLPASYGEQAIQACIDQGKCYVLDNKFEGGLPCLLELKSFIWEKTPQGYEYWSDLHDRLLSEEKMVDTSVTQFIKTKKPQIQWD